MRSIGIVCLLLLASTARGQPGPDHHRLPHKMILFGQNELYASHITYKEPHNYQVILALKLPERARQEYLAARKRYPNGMFILLLESLEIDKIESKQALVGSIFRSGKDNEKTSVSKDVRLSKSDYEVIFFNELPVSLGAETAK